MYFITASDRSPMGLVPAFGSKALKIIFVVLLNPCKRELVAPLPIHPRREKQELVEKVVTLQPELWLSAVSRGPSRFPSAFLSLCAWMSGSSSIPGSSAQLLPPGPAAPETSPLRILATRCSVSLWGNLKRESNTTKTFKNPH